MTSIISLPEMGYNHFDEEILHNPAKTADTQLGKDNDIRLPDLAISGPEYGHHLIGQALYSRVSGINVDVCTPGEENPFFVADMGEVYRQYRRWCKALPRVAPHYAVKCNPDPALVKFLDRLGCGFDCASKTEIGQVLSLGVSPDRIVYAQPVKTKSFVTHARAKNVSLMTFDNSDELLKIKQLYPEARLLLRIATDDSASLCQFSMKFGATLANVPTLLSTARRLGLDVAGVAFHVGSGASDPNAFSKAINDARRVFDMAIACGLSPRILDIGGGFSHTTFESMATAVSDAIERFFPADKNPGLKIMAEPGRYFAAAAYVLATNVIARRVVQEDKSSSSPLAGTPDVNDWVKQQIEILSQNASDSALVDSCSQAASTERIMLYTNDGVYGNFSNIMFDHQKPIPKVLTRQGHFMYETSATGALPRLPSELAKYNLSAEEFASACPTPLTFSSNSTVSTGFSSPVRNNSSDSLYRPSFDASKKYEYSIWGPTCDGIDCISDSCELEGKLNIGDWLYFEEMGAYTLCSATAFNGFSNDHDVIYVCSEPAAYSYLIPNNPSQV